MKKIFILLMGLMLAGCVQSPTRSTDVVDDRPGLSFQLASMAASAYEVKINGVTYGPVSQYLAGENRLRLVNGSHRIELINHSGKVVFNEKVYLGAGSNRTLSVGSHE